MASVWIVGKLESDKILLSAIYGDELSASKVLRAIYDSYYQMSLCHSRPWHKCYFFRGCPYDIFEVKVRTLE